MKMLRVKKWEDFQHYRDRDPIWIKVYTRLLDDADFLELSEAAQGQLLKLWLLASRCRNAIRDDGRFLRHALHTDKLHVEALVTAGFLERYASKVLAEPEQGASNLLADSEHDASKLLALAGAGARGHTRSREGEGELEGELELEQTPPARETVSDIPWAAAAHADAFAVFKRESRRPASLSVTLRAVQDGMQGPNGQPCTWEEIGQSLAEMAANGQTFGVALLRSCILRLRREAADPRSNGKSLESFTAQAERVARSISTRARELTGHA